MASLLPAVACLGVAFVFTCFENPVGLIWAAMAIGYSIAAWSQRV